MMIARQHYWTFGDCSSYRKTFVWHLFSSFVCPYDDTVLSESEWSLHSSSCSDEMWLYWNFAKTDTTDCLKSIITQDLRDTDKERKKKHGGNPTSLKPSRETFLTFPESIILLVPTKHYIAFLIFKTWSSSKKSFMPVQELYYTSTHNSLKHKKQTWTRLWNNVICKKSELKANRINEAF